MSRAVPPLVVVVCGDPGGASAMAPVLERLLEGHVSVQALAYKEARSVWRSRGLPFEELPDETSESDAQDLLSKSRAAALVVGTSVNSVDLERRFITAARRLGTPSLALLDFWSSYLDRFADADGKLSHVPDLVAVMDDSARAEMIGLGVEPSRLVVTGQPAFDVLRPLRAEFTAAKRRSIRHSLGAVPEAQLIAFVSQPIAAVFGSTPANPRCLGYTEHDVLKALIGALEHVSQGGARLVLAVLPHPREDPRAFAELSSDDLDVTVSGQHASLEVVMSADLVVGMNSILLMEACYLGCPTLSLQPGLRGADTLPTNRMGLSRAVYDAADIEATVADLLVNEDSRRSLVEGLSDFRVDGGAAKRVTEVIYGLCDGPRLHGRRSPGEGGQCTLGVRDRRPASGRQEHAKGVVSGRRGRLR